MTTISKNDKLEKLLQQKAKIESEISRTQTAAKSEARKLDSRRKIVLGAALLKGIMTGKISEETARNIIKNFASERDQKIFETYEFPTLKKGD